MAQREPAHSEAIVGFLDPTNGGGHMGGTNVPLVMCPKTPHIWQYCIHSPMCELPINVLTSTQLVCDKGGRHVSSLGLHINAFCQHSTVRVTIPDTLNTLGTAVAYGHSPTQLKISPFARN